MNNNDIRNKIDIRIKEFAEDNKKINRINKNTDYIIYNNVLKLDLFLDEYIIPLIPKNKGFLRIELQETKFNLVKNIFAAYYTDARIRASNVREACVNLSVIDHLISKLSVFNIINEKNEKQVAIYLNNIKNPLFGWKYNLENGN